jgi:hypothetical protein
MATTPSYVTFGLKVFLFVHECIKYKYSYDMAPAFDNLKQAYLNADSAALPNSFRGARTARKPMQFHGAAQGEPLGLPEESKQQSNIHSSKDH